MNKIAIDLGHGHQTKGNLGGDGGAVGFLNEEDVINSIGELVIRKLRNMNYNVIETRPLSASSVSNSLYLRYTKADNNGVEACVSIHANCGGGHGSEIFTYGAKDVLGASTMLKGFTQLGFTNRGIKDGSHLAMVKRPASPAMLIELFFVDSQFDTSLYKTVGAERFADIIVSGLTNTPIANVASTNTGKYKVGWNQEADGRWWYADSPNTYYKDCWKIINNNWYCFGSDGYTKTATWELYNGKWYYLDVDGKMKVSDWELSDGKWYYLASDGSMLTNSFVSSKTNNKLYFVGNDGAMKVSTFFEFNGAEYYAYEDGSIAVNTTISGKKIGPDMKVIK